MEQRDEYCHASDAGWIKFPTQEAASGSTDGNNVVWHCAGCGWWHVTTLWIEVVEDSGKFEFRCRGARERSSAGIREQGRAVGNSIPIK